MMIELSKIGSKPAKMKTEADIQAFFATHGINLPGIKTQKDKK
jgi:hypothetical protein